MNDCGYDIGSTVGKWTAWVPPRGYDRSIGLHLFRRQHPGTAYHDAATGVISVIPTMEVVKFTLEQTPDGEFSPNGPALKDDAFSNMGENEVIQFLQAIVNEAAKLGIYAAGTKDLTRELTAVRAHLEDMRRLSLQDTQPIVKER